MKEPPNPHELGGEPWQELFDQAGPAPALDPATKDRMRRDLTTRFHARHGRGQRPRWRLAVLWAAAASFALCALLVWWVWRPAVARVEAIVSAGDVTVNGRSPAVGDEIRLGDRVRVQAQARLTLSIDDISLRLAASEGPADLEWQARDRVRLSSGKLYFDRAVPAVPVARKILAVHTPWGEVRDAGTQYQLDVSADGLWIRVREGRISLSGRSRDAELSAGRALLLDADGTLTEIDEVGFGEAWSWTLEAAPPFALDGVHRGRAAALDRPGNRLGHRLCLRLVAPKGRARNPAWRHAGPTG